MGVDEEHGLVVSDSSAVPGGATKPLANKNLAVIGAGPAGLYAAERLAGLGMRVTVYERMASPARKFLMAGRGGLNLTHSEPLETFLTRYTGSAAPLVRDAISAFPPSALVAWANELGADTFTGSSGRVFPKAMKASPLLRAWLRRLGGLGVELKTGWTWRGFADDPRTLQFDTADGPQLVSADAVLLALGGASWPRLGSDGAWVGLLEARGATIAPLKPSNCGVTVAWSAHMDRFAGAPLKRIRLSCGNTTRAGEALITKSGLEGGAVYALSHELRSALSAGPAPIIIDLRPDFSHDDLAQRLAKAPPKSSLSNTLRKNAGLSPAAASLLREAGPLPHGPALLAERIKAMPLTVTGLAGLGRAISTAGGIEAGALSDHFMLRALPGIYAAGEMLDVDAPTGGYLLQAAFATGGRTAEGIVRALADDEKRRLSGPGRTA